MAVGNLLGAVVVFDAENPRSFSAVAGETISGGQFVYVSGDSATSQVGSQAASFKTTDLVVKLCDTMGYCNGMALANAGTGDVVSVATRGTYLIKSAGEISGGTLVTQNGRPDAVSPAGITDVGSWVGIIGRSLTNAGSEDYCLVSLNL